MAREMNLSQTAIRESGALGLQPHRHETFKLSSDPLFVDKASGASRPMKFWRASNGFAPVSVTHRSERNGPRYCCY